MDFAATMRDVARRSEVASSLAMTEEATKTSVILPFIRALGYDVFSLAEVEPEFTADVGTKKGEKVDFALKIEGKVVMLVEAKPINAPLGNNQHSQLYRYFAVTNTRIALLTNGKEFQFFSDTEETNRMDKKPFLAFNIQSLDDKIIAEVAKFHKDTFSVENIIESASKNKNTKEAANFLRDQLSDPSDDFVRFVAKTFYEGTLTKTAIDNLRPSIKGALDDVIKDRLSVKLNVAFSSADDEKKNTEAAGEKDTKTETGIETTEDELQAFMIVRAIALQAIDVDRITFRDSKSYCAVFADDNNRKPICRFYFNSKSNYQLGIFDESKNETRHKIQKVSEIYSFAKQIAQVAKQYV